MKRFACVAVVTLFMAAGCDDSPTNPSDPNVVVLTSSLLSSNEVPPISNEDATARGSVRVTFSVNRDAGNNVTGGTATFFISMTGFPEGTTLTGAHIHPGAAGVNGGVILSTGLSTANSAGAIVNGGGNLTFTVPVNATVLNQILNSPENHYFNVHTTRNLPGAIRGQLAREN